MMQTRAAPNAALRSSRGTPFHASTSALNQTTWWYGWGPYVIPDVYSAMPEELAAIRQHVAVIDMSPLPKVRLTGKDALRLADRLVTRDLAKLGVRQVLYTPWCAESGHLIGDGLVFRAAQDRCILSGELSQGHVRQQAAGFDVEVADITDELGVLSLQGPRSRFVLERASGESWAELAFSRIRHARIEGAGVMVARQGFTGEHGYELWVAREDGARVWDAIMAAGEADGIKPAGEYAVDIARIEAGLLLVSAEYTGASWDNRCANLVVDPRNLATPYEVGLGRFVDLGKATFCGRPALAAEFEGQRTARKFVGLQVQANDIATLLARHNRAPNVSPRVRWDSMPVRRNGKIVGRASSLTWSPTIGNIIGFGCLLKDSAGGDALLQIDWSDEWGQPLGPVTATIVGTPFIGLRRSA